jgi:hypothetical protein
LKIAVGFLLFSGSAFSCGRLAEFKSCNDELAGSIINKTIDSSFTYYINDSNYCFPLDGEKRRAYTALLQTDGSKAKELLLNLLREIPKDHRNFIRYY